MRLNTAKSMKLARRVKSRFGTWQAVREAAHVKNGVYVVGSTGSREERAPHEVTRPVKV